MVERSQSQDANGPEGGESPCWAHLVDTVRDDVPGDAVLASVLRASADAVVIADPSGVITFWNDAAVTMFGWSAAQAVGRSLDLIIPDAQRRRHWDGYRQVMATGVTRYGTDVLRVPAANAEGERRSIAFTVTLLRDGDQRVSAIAAIIRDETERWREEQALRRELRALGGGMAVGGVDH